MNRLLIAFLLLCASSAVHAQATRTWVSGVGDDVNPCSRTAPCKTFAGAISKTATGGEISVLDPGGFGAVVITKSITIDGGGLGSVLGAGTNGITINLTAADDGAKTVRIRGLSLNGAGSGVSGIRVLAGKQVVIEDTAISGFNDGVAVLAPGAKVLVRDCTISGNRGTGIQVSGSGAEVLMYGAAVFGNATGLASSGGGSIVSFRNNLVSGNLSDGAPSSAAAQQ